VACKADLIENRECGRESRFIRKEKISRRKEI
jgi:hypothetical protein